MSKKLYKVSLAIFALVLLFSVNAIAQESRTGTNAASELLIPVGARYMAMGGSSIATVEGIEAIHWNPAGLAKGQYGASVMFSRMSHIAGVNVNYVAVSSNFGGFGTLGFNIKALDIGDILVTTEDAPDGTGGIISPQFVTGGITYAKQLTDRIAIGATATLISEKIDRVSASGFAFDFGVQYSNLANIDGFSIAVAIKNIGPSMQYGGSGLLRRAQDRTGDRGDSPFAVVAASDELPSAMELGVAYSMAMGEESTLQFSGVYQDNNFIEDVTRLGGEYSFQDMFFVRAGYSFAPDSQDDAAGQTNYIYGLTFGGGITYDFANVGVSIDYTYRQVDVFDASNVFSIKLGF